MMRLKVRSLIVYSCLFGLAYEQAAATLLNLSGGYQYIAGDNSYWGQDFWTRGHARLNGGWYPNAQLGYSFDRYYRQIISPGVGIEKGIAGLGRIRAGYVYYNGELRDVNVWGDSHEWEAGFFKAFNPHFSSDFAYRVTSGNLFGGVDRGLNLDNASLRHSVFHQGAVTLAWDDDFKKHPFRVDAGFSVARDAKRELGTESVSLSAPVAGPLFAHMGVTFLQASSNLNRTYWLFGLYCAFDENLGRTK